MSANLLSGCFLICGFQTPEKNRNNLFEALYGGKKIRERSLLTLGIWDDWKKLLDE